MERNITSYMKIKEGTITDELFDACLSSSGYFPLQALIGNKLLSEEQLVKVINHLQNSTKFSNNFDTLIQKTAEHPNFSQTASDTILNYINSSTYVPPRAMKLIKMLLSAMKSPNISPIYLKSLNESDNELVTVALHINGNVDDARFISACNKINIQTLFGIYKNFYQSRCDISIECLKKFHEVGKNEKSFSGGTLLSEKHATQMVNILSEQAGTSNIPDEWKRRMFL